MLHWLNLTIFSAGGKNERNSLVMGDYYEHSFQPQGTKGKIPRKKTATQYKDNIQI